MTLREFSQLHLFTDDTYVFIFRTNGSSAYIAEYDRKVTLGNCTKALIPEILDKEISVIQPESNALIIYFKEVR